MKAKHVLITAFFWIVLGASVQGQTIGWNFGTSSGTASPNVTTANVTSSNVAQGNNNGTTTMLDKSQESKDYPGASGKFNAGAAARRGALNIGASGSAYFEFTLTPASGYAVTLTAISFGSKSKDKGPQAYTLRTSLDNYGSDKASGTLSNNDKWALHSNASLSVASAASTPITFRIYGYAGDRDTGEDEAIWRIDDLMLSVTASRVIPAPTITSFSPTSGGIGASVTITGTNFTGTTSVKFNGTNQPTFTVVDPTSITTTVPAGATTGPISVTTAGGTATSGTSFTVIPAPTITSFSPTSGEIGAGVTIDGTDLSGATSVTFNGTSATILTNTALQITTTVPAGATTGAISVTTPGGTATSSSNFTVAPQKTTTQMNEGWNLVSVPRVPVDSSTSVLFPNAVPGSVNSYLTESYTQPAKLNTGEGYWALYSAADSNTISGTAITSASITVSTGNRWVLIGSVTESIAATGLVSNPPDAIVPNTLYGWDGSTYFAASSLLPGKGYWVLVNAPCTLTVSSPPPAATSVKSVSGISRPSIKDTNKVEKRALSPGGN